MASISITRNVPSRVRADILKASIDPIAGFKTTWSTNVGCLQRDLQFRDGHFRASTPREHNSTKHFRQCAARHRKISTAITYSEATPAMAACVHAPAHVSPDAALAPEDMPLQKAGENPPL
jgi:hypothetical protein